MRHFEVGLMVACIGLVAAAGHGTRLAAALPKQHLPLPTGTMLELSVRAVLSDSRIDHVAVLAAPGDEQVGQAAVVGDRRVRILYCGAATRAGTVAAALAAYGDRVGGQTMMVVHDAARPLLHQADLARVIDAALADACGALLAVPVADTIKRAARGRSRQTLSRRDLWAAATPQCARLDLLRQALGRAADAADEAEALERIGQSMLLVEAAHSNPKITRPADLVLATALLEARARRASDEGLAE